MIYIHRVHARPAGAREAHDKEKAAENRQTGAVHPKTLEHRRKGTPLPRPIAIARSCRSTATPEYRQFGGLSWDVPKASGHHF